MSGGGSVSSGDTRFERKGTSRTTSWRQMGQAHEGRFVRALDATRPGSADGSVNDMLTGRIRGQVGNRPYAPEICSLVRSNLPNQKSPAQAALTKTANRDVFGEDYANKTFDRYAEEVQKAMAHSRSGPAMTRGGTAAQGFAQAQAVNDLALNREGVLAQNRGVDGQLAQGAAALLGQNRHQMNADATQAIGQGQQGYAQFLQNMMAAAGLASERTKMYADIVPTYATIDGKMIGTEKNDLHGRGAQSSSSLGGGINVCCFIFMEAYNGELPKHVRECRDEFAPENSARRVGYIKMSKWLVPAMRVNGFTRRLVNHLLVKPLTRWGAWYKKEPGGSFCYLDALAKAFWFKVWEIYGTKK